jgi:Bacterial low temperature requirement A protein (LtrA)
LVGFFGQVAAELAVPAWAEFGGRPTPWHLGHITERYGEFTIIVLGEVVAAIATAVQEAVDQSRTSPRPDHRRSRRATAGFRAVVVVFKHSATEESGNRCPGRSCGRLRTT